ncbi:hypothetical protein V1478_000942 [Vespula squamosa]|uniref:Uncharacterized protein n=1 Tax=Vespula squamosa TaxID=30214 RepID=A0ABD2C6X4_VESSQ
MRGVILHLRSLFVITCKERIPWELRCALLGIQCKAEREGHPVRISMFARQSTKKNCSSNRQSKS